MIKVDRKAHDRVELWADDRYYLVVRRYRDRWEVERHSRGSLVGGTDLAQFGTAKEAVEFAKGYLQAGMEELDGALKDAGL